MAPATPSSADTRRHQTRPELHAALRDYRTLLDWPVYVDPVGRLAVNTGVVPDAVTLPAALGIAVHRELDISMLPAPVMSDQVLGRWTILTAPAETARMKVPRDLDHARVRPVPRGAPVLVPLSVSVGRDGDRYWVSGPGRGPLPPWTAVLGATRRVVNRAVR